MRCKGWSLRQRGRFPSVVLVLLLTVCACAGAASVTAPVAPFEVANWSTPANIIDAAVEAELTKQGLRLRNPSSDAVFVRRIYLDMLGTLPKPAEVDAFLQDPRSDRRGRLIESLFDREEFADYRSLKWCDLLRVKSEFPINLWPNAVQAYHHWIRESIAQNMPYDQFVRELLTSSGSNSRVPQVNFYRSIPDRSPEGLAKAAALVFMGMRLEKLPEARRADMAAFFSKVSYKKTVEWKEEIVLSNPAPSDPIGGVLPDGSRVSIPADADPRQAFANWLTAPANPWFSRNAVNRIWAWTMGHGIIDEVDDIRPDNPPASPALLTCLEGELVRSRYDQRHIYRLIYNSRTYQQSSIAPVSLGAGQEGQGAHFARYTVRRLDAEVLIDALCWIGGYGEAYSSPIPEPFTYIPTENRTIALADGSITSPFLATFGRPSRDTGLESERNNEPSDAQRLSLLNSRDVQSRIEKSPQLKEVVAAAKGKRPAAIQGIYVIILSRYPTPAEANAAERYMKSGGLQLRQAAADLAWALINTKEFLYRH